MDMLGRRIMNWRIIRTEKGNSFIGVLDPRLCKIPLEPYFNLCSHPVTVQAFAMKTKHRFVYHPTVQRTKHHPFPFVVPL